MPFDENKPSTTPENFELLSILRRIHDRGSIREFDIAAQGAFFTLCTLVFNVCGPARLNEMIEVLNQTLPPLN
jgi:hypothetical protein